MNANINPLSNSNNSLKPNTANNPTAKVAKTNQTQTQTQTATRSTHATTANAQANPHAAKASPKLIANSSSRTLKSSAIRSQSSAQALKAPRAQPSQINAPQVAIPNLAKLANQLKLNNPIMHKTLMQNIPDIASNNFAFKSASFLALFEKDALDSFFGKKLAKNINQFVKENEPHNPRAQQAGQQNKAKKPEQSKSQKFASTPILIGEDIKEMRIRAIDFDFEKEDGKKLRREKELPIQRFIIELEYVALGQIQLECLCDSENKRFNMLVRSQYDFNEKQKKELVNQIYSPLEARGWSSNAKFIKGLIDYENNDKKTAKFYESNI